jgi:hypothetical protein
MDLSVFATLSKEQNGVLHNLLYEAPGSDHTLNSDELPTVGEVGQRPFHNPTSN